MSSLPPHCVPASPLLETLSGVFNTCIPSYLSLASTTCGLLSITSWLFAQMPQIWKNYTRGSVEGLSLGFLAIWLAGDICALPPNSTLLGHKTDLLGNFLGAIWTGQMWFQQVVGLYYVLVDCILVLQFFYFSAGTPVLVDDTLSVSSADSASSEPKKKRTPVKSRSLASTLIVSISLLAHVAGASPTHSPTAASLDTPSTFLLLDTATLGCYLSWFSTLLYLTSRLPQLLMNLQRRSTSGLAISLFIAAFFGNAFYSLSLLLNPLGHADYPAYGGGGVAGPDGSTSEEWWGRTLPFFLGAAGVLSLDAAVGWQWVLWGEGVEGMEGGMGSSGFEEEVASGGWWPWGGWWRNGEGERLLGEEYGYGAVAGRA